MHVEIYTRPGCNFCNLAKSLLNKLNIPFVEQKLDIDFTREILIEKFATAKTYPVIVVDGFYIGGYTDLHNMLSEKIGPEINQTLLSESL